MVRAPAGKSLRHLYGYRENCQPFRRLLQGTHYRRSTHIRGVQSLACAHYPADNLSGQVSEGTADYCHQTRTGPPNPHRPGHGHPRQTFDRVMGSLPDHSASARQCPASDGTYQPDPHRTATQIKISRRRSERRDCARSSRALDSHPCRIFMHRSALSTCPLLPLRGRTADDQRHAGRGGWLSRRPGRAARLVRRRCLGAWLSCAVSRP